jgi:SAM-dependent methyltransferase
VRPGVRSRLHAGWQKYADLPHWVGLRRLGEGRGADYRDYLTIQLRRTLSKRANDPGVGARLLVDTVAREVASGQASVLCVGCRNRVELDEFRSRGFEDVVGIDLFSRDDDIRVMDMHDMAFADDSFDVVYASHALEHAYDVPTVVSEMTRVAKAGGVIAVEVPVRHRADPADAVEFPGLDALRQAFRPHVREELLAEEQPARSEANDQGSDIARLVFRIEKGA